MQDPRVFGPAMWFTFHAIAQGYPLNPSARTQQHATNFILAIPSLIPCEVCAEHARTYVELHYMEITRAVKSKDALIDFFIDFHNHANRITGKKLMNNRDARHKYENFRIQDRYKF